MMPCRRRRCRPPSSIAVAHDAAADPRIPVDQYVAGSPVSDRREMTTGCHHGRVTGRNGAGAAGRAGALAEAMAESGHYSIDSTSVRAHLSAAGGKGGFINELLAGRGAGSPVR